MRRAGRIIPPRFVAAMVLTLYSRRSTRPALGNTRRKGFEVFQRLREASGVFPALFTLTDRLSDIEA